MCCFQLEIRISSNLRKTCAKNAEKQLEKSAREISRHLQREELRPVAGRRLLGERVPWALTSGGVVNGGVSLRFCWGNRKY